MQPPGPPLTQSCRRWGRDRGSPASPNATPCRAATPCCPPPADNDVIGLAQTGSCKTGAFALPILQGLLDKPQELYALVLSPTRELAIQIAEQFEALGSGIGLKAAVLVGGIDMMAQAIAIAKRPHVIVGTPGRVVDHLSNTKASRLLRRRRQRRPRLTGQCSTPPGSQLLLVVAAARQAWPGGGAPTAPGGGRAAGC